MLRLERLIQSTLMKQAIILVRASSAKQASEGDSLEHQLEQCRLYIKKQGWQEKKVFPLIESGVKGERQYFQEIIDYATEPKNKVDVLVFKHINRFTRGGSNDYSKWKTKLENSGVRITDIYNTIGEKINTLDHLNTEYEWSNYSPSESAEFEVANQAKADRRNILTQTIGAEITYTRQGYYPRVSPYGYTTSKIETEHGRRTILVEKPEESFYIKKAFEMRAQGFNLREIAEEINKLGYKSRIKNKRDKRTKKAIGKIGGNPAKANRVAEMFKRPIYTGIICEKWTNYQPVKAKFPGFIDVELFNQANKNNILIQIKNDKAFIFYGEEAGTERIKRRVMKHNPLYPFKKVVLCPKCKSDLRGSAPTGGSGKKHPQYHCSKKHSYWFVSADKFNKKIYEFIKQIRFDEDNHRLLEGLFYEKWDKKRAGVIEESRVKESYVADILAEQKAVFDSIKKVDSDIVRKALEADYEKLEKKLKDARKKRDSQVKKEVNAKLGFHYSKYFMEHLDELLIDTKNVRRQQQLFGMLFNELPTYDQIIDGTANLTEYIQLNGSKNLTGEPDRTRTGDLLRDRETC